jgi:hypothetical protein
MIAETLFIDQPVTIETNLTGGLVIAMRRTPVKFEQVYDSKNFTWTMRATWKPE